MHAACAQCCGVVHVDRFWLKPWLLGFGAVQYAGLLRGSIGPNASTQSYILSFGGKGQLAYGTSNM